MSAPRPETLAKRLFQSQLRERRTQFRKSDGIGHNQKGIVLAWPARKKFVCYVSMQLHERKPGFTVEAGWSRGEIDSFFRLPRYEQRAGRSKRLGERDQGSLRASASATSSAR